VNYRCRSCSARFSTTYTYKRKPKCRRCGSTDLRNDTANVRRWNARFPKCECGLIPFPHRPGSSVGDDCCAKHPDCNPWG